MRLEWSIFAMTDREAIFDYIEADSPRSAVAVDDRIEARVRDLARFPEMGRPGRVAGTRELVVHRTPFVVVYRINEDRILILRVIHGAQEWPESMPYEPAQERLRNLAHNSKPRNLYSCACPGAAK